MAEKSKSSKVGNKTRSKVEKVMREFHEGELKSSSGKKVTDRKQAAAIGYSMARRGKK